MSRGVNKVIIIGNLGQDPETKYSAGGAAITNISVATSESWKDKQTGQKQERTEWHRVVFFNRLAEISGQYLKKGSKVYIEGSLKTDKWKDQNGQDRQSTNIVASEMQMLDNRGDNNDSLNNDLTGIVTPKNPNAVQNGINYPSGIVQGNQPHHQSPGMDDFEDPDLPF